MKTQNQNSEQLKASGKASFIVLTTSMMICLTLGWFLGSITTKAFSQSTKQNGTYKNGAIVLPAFPIHGEALPIIILKEFSVVSNKQ